jgi:hypothetical protein
MDNLKVNKIYVSLVLFMYVIITSARPAYYLYTVYF